MAFYLLLGFLGSFIGTLPLGPINLSVVDTTLKRSFKSAMYLALAASIIELIYSYISFECSIALMEAIEGNAWIPWLVAGLFIVGGVFFFLKKAKEKDPEKPPKKDSFLRGLIIAILNPQAIPYWLFVIGYYQAMHWIDLGASSMLELAIFFVVGAAIGKMASLPVVQFQ